MGYQFTFKCENKSAKEIWQFIQDGLSKEVTIKSIKDKIPYTVHQVTVTSPFLGQVVNIQFHK